MSVLLQDEALAKVGMIMAEHGVVVVSGGTAGVGRAVVREFADHGYDMAVLGRGQAGLEGAAADVDSNGRRVLPIRTDVAELEQVQEAAARVERELGPIDIWVNVAFVGALKFFWDTDEDVYRRITDLTYLGQVHGTKAALAHMRPRNRGVVVQVGSALGYRGIPLQSAYCGAKHAVKGFTESVITELKHEKSHVRLSMVELPGVNTTQFNWNDTEFDQHPMPVPPIYEPEVAARVVRFAAEHRRRNMWVGLPTAYTILGNRVAPVFLDWYLGKTGVKSQLTRLDAPRYGSNVFAAKDQESDRGSHGAFDAKAHAHDPWSWASMRRMPLMAAGAAASAIATAVWMRPSSD